MTRRLLALALLGVLAAAGMLASASAKEKPPVTAQLDRDAEKERIEDRDVRCLGEEGAHEPPCAEGDVARKQVVLVDPCGGEAVRVNLLPESHDFLTAYSAPQIDSTGPREIFAEGRSGASGRAGDAVIARLRPGAPCGRLQILLRAPGTHRTQKPKGASYGTDPLVEVKDLDRSRKGLEVRLTQNWYRRGDGGCCPTWESTRLLRLRDGKFVTYRSRIREVPRG